MQNLRLRFTSCLVCQAVKSYLPMPAPGRDDSLGFQVLEGRCDRPFGQSGSPDIGPITIRPSPLKLGDGDAVLFLISSVLQGAGYK